MWGGAAGQLKCLLQWVGVRVLWQQTQNLS